MIEPYERKTNYYETDQMGIIHHSNYIRYIEEARMHCMGQYGLSYEVIEEMGIIIPVLGVDVQYKQAIRYGDTILIDQWVDKFSPVKYSVSYEIRNKETGVLHATAHTDHCFVDKNLVPVRLKRDYPEMYEKFKEIAKKDQERLLNR